MRRRGAAGQRRASGEYSVLRGGACQLSRWVSANSRADAGGECSPDVDRLNIWRPMPSRLLAAATRDSRSRRYQRRRRPRQCRYRRPNARPPRGSTPPTCRCQHRGRLQGVPSVVSASAGVGGRGCRLGQTRVDATNAVSSVCGHRARAAGVVRTTGSYAWVQRVNAAAVSSGCGHRRTRRHRGGLKHTQGSRRDEQHTRVNTGVVSSGCCSVRCRGRCCNINRRSISMLTRCYHTYTKVRLISAQLEIER